MRKCCIGTFEIQEECIYRSCFLVLVLLCSEKRKAHNSRVDTYHHDSYTNVLMLFYIDEL